MKLKSIVKIRQKSRILLFGLLCLTLFPLSVPAQAESAKAAAPVDPVQWVRTHFAKGKTPPFSFVYDGKRSADFLRKWKYTMQEAETTGPGVKEYVFTYADRSSGLLVECRAKAFIDFAAVEWVLNFKNTSGANSATISRVKAVDLDLQYPGKADYVVHYADGSHVSKADFHQRTKVLAPGDSLYMAPQGGRSSQVAFPFFNIESPSDGGVVAAVGWTGTWYADIAATSGHGVRLDAGMKTLETYLYPDESIRTPSICLLFWQGDDRMAGQNAFRRFVLAHHTQQIDGKTAKYPVSTSFNYSDPYPCNEYSCLTADYAIALVDRYKCFDLVPDVFWLDAGWYTGAGDYKNNRNWANTVGNWSVDTGRFPDGLKPVSDAVHRAGAKFMVWFEPERVMKDSEWGKAHPEFMLEAEGPDCYLFNLCDPKAREWLCDQIGELIEQNGIDYYRQDFNTEPDIFWRANDKPGRTGITEIRYIEGLYAFWDYLLQRFPGLLIDNCASGGRRIDLETTSRSAPMWRTDYNYGEPVGYQCHTYGLHTWLPLHGTGVMKVDKFTFRSSLGTSAIYNWKVTDGNNSFLDMQERMAEFDEVRPYFYEDFYPLSGEGDVTGNDIWLAYQLLRPSDQSGFVVAFRRADCPENTYTMKLKGLDPERTYRIEGYDDRKPFMLTGRQLSEGFTLTAGDTRTSFVVKYEAQ